MTDWWIPRTVEDLENIADLDPDALAALTNVIDGLIAKNRLRALADDIS